MTFDYKKPNYTEHQEASNDRYTVCFICNSNNNPIANSYCSNPNLVAEGLEDITDKFTIILVSCGSYAERFTKVKYEEKD